MAQKDLSVMVEIIDSWLDDPVDRGSKPMKLYVLWIVNGEMQLYEEDYIEENYA